MQCIVLNSIQLMNQHALFIPFAPFLLMEYACIILLQPAWLVGKYQLNKSTLPSCVCMRWCCYLRVPRTACICMNKLTTAGMRTHETHDQKEQINISVSIYLYFYSILPVDYYNLPTAVRTKLDVHGACLHSYMNAKTNFSNRRSLLLNNHIHVTLYITTLL